MRRYWLCGSIAVVLLGAGAALSFPDADDGKSLRGDEFLRSAAAVSDQAPPLVVHEWGTFTSFSGSDGVKLEFRPLTENDLPGFVINRAKQSGTWLGKPSIAAIQRMETPVTYFYTPVERDVSVRVDFPEGLLTEFYPPVRDYAPKVDVLADDWSRIWEQSSVHSAAPLKDSMLDWGTIHLIPPETLSAQVEDEELARRIGRHVERTMVPEAGRHDHYAAARETDSAIVQLRYQPDEDDVTGIPPADYFEKFLFYRGVGNFDLPLTLEAAGDGQFTLTNDGPDEIRSLFLVTVRGDIEEDDVWFRRYDGIAPHSTLTLEQSEFAMNIDRLANQVADALEAEGLYEKEARAMVNTWRTSWFGEEGTRLFYIVPGRITDELLPLHIEPQPTSIVRVLVGRMEIMSPDEETRILDLVAESADARAAHEAAATETPFASPVLDDLLALGRLGEPALVRARNITDGDVSEEAERLLEELRAAHDAAVQ